MGLAKDLIKLGAIMIAAVAVEKLADAARRKKDPQNARNTGTPDTASVNSHNPVECRRCHFETTSPVIIDGKPVCPMCAMAITSEKNKGYDHGPGFGRISHRCCARCGVDLLQLEPAQIRSIDECEYCDVCAVKITRAQERSKEVLEQIMAYMASLFPDAIHEIYESGDHLIKSPDNDHGNAIQVWIDQEITLEFADWHHHYGFEIADMAEFYDDLNGLFLGKLCVACSYSKGMEDNAQEDDEEYWRGSSLMHEEQLTEEELYREFLKNQKVICSFWDASKDRTFIIKTGMTEITEDEFYTVFQNCPQCVLDYCLLKSRKTYQTPSSHREAIQVAMEKVHSFSFDIQKAKAQKLDAEKFLSVPTVPWVHKSKGMQYFIDEVVGDKLQYWFAFLEPPYGAGPLMRNGHVIQKGLTIDDFHLVNKTLFPNGPKFLTVMEWTTDWSDYFDAGHEWWGAACWSIYDRSLDRYVVILASATD